MKKVFDFGKIDYSNKGIATNIVTVEVEYKEKKDGNKVFSACGNIWNSRKTDTLCGGQCLATIAEYINDSTFKEIYRLWQLHHLNDMHPECNHQHELGWQEIAKEDVMLYNWRLNSETLGKQEEIKKLALNALKDCKTFTPIPEQSAIFALSYFLKTETAELPKELKDYYKPKESLYIGDERHAETKRLGWLKEKDHSKGILCKPCPVCGYEYGSKWVYFPIPEADEKIIISLLGEETL